MTAPLLFITGASSGIGQAMALEWARRGGRLALVARRGDEMRTWVAAQGWSSERATVYVADARDMAAMVAAGRACIEAQGLPDVVIASAGISVGVDLGVEADLEVLRAVIETNDLGLAATFQPFIAPMCARRSGRLVGIASVAGIRGLPGHAAYSLSKAGVISLCESLRVECRPFGVRVVTIAPGYIDTPLTRGNSYSMPFLMPADKFARQALDAIAAGVGLRVIPWQMGMLARVLRILPDWIYDRAVSGRGRKARKAQ
ncbi:SDR family oxidoreductase [Scleromatobacter humisilvae]|uniref:SDR family oxidoreductase n=1 Tax=Scleromatobacter humisilvae TaxID=2897159 RepID=A0A9X1YPR3_9BURK|nr:SDR family oxidoreductase [Scleromatobacter humisilvae]MCK9688828.1 SDR family oxidoreductase [Scleromatobacter humisilvae]